MKFVLGLGTNCGDRLAYLRMAIEKLASRSNLHAVRLLKVSPIYQSDALLPEGAPADWNKPFLNLCVLIESSLTPPELLKLAKGIEQDLGRAARGRWAPREIDIDLLAMEHGTHSADVAQKAFYLASAGGRRSGVVHLAIRSPLEASDGSRIPGCSIPYAPHFLFADSMDGDHQRHARLL
jgi:2-amino-4-hydroxy-6-hydroxymethyldihydropteridine diphosphokinase